MMGKKSGLMIVSVLLLAFMSAVLINSSSVSAAPDADQQIVYENLSFKKDVGSPGWYDLTFAVTNVGDEDKIKTMDVFVDGTVRTSKVRYLPAGETKEITVSVELYRAGEHSIRVETSSPITATVDRVPAEFEFGDLKVDFENGIISAALSATNHGSLEGDVSFNFYVNGKEKEGKTYTVGPSSKVTASFEYEAEKSGTYWVRVNDQIARVDVPGVLAQGGLEVSFDSPTFSGRVIGDPEKVEGKFGRAAKLDPDDIIVTNYTRNLAEGFTSTAWIKHEYGPDVSSGQETGCFITKTFVSGWAPGGEYFGLGFGNQKLFVMNFRGGTSVVGETPLKEGEWYHVAATYNPETETRKLYLNGELDGIAEKPIPDDQHGMPILIGGAKAWPPGLDGTIDEVKVADHALSQSQIKNIYENNVSIRKPGSHMTEWRSFEENHSWKSLKAVTNIPVGGEITTTVQVSSNGEDVLDNITLSLEDGSNSYDLSALESAKYARIKTELSGGSMVDSYTLTNVYGVEKSWKLKSDWARGSGSAVSYTRANLPSQITIENLTVNPEMVLSGEEVNVTADVKNPGASRGEELVTFSVDGVLDNTEMVSLSPGEVTTVEFGVSREELGAHTVELGGKTSKFIVAASEANMLGSHTEMTLEEKSSGIVRRSSPTVPAVAKEPVIFPQKWRLAEGVSRPNTTFLGTPTLTRGKAGKAIKLDRGDSIAKSDVVSIHDGFTYSAWIKRKYNDEHAWWVSYGVMMTKSFPDSWAPGGKYFGVGYGNHLFMSTYTGAMQVTGETPLEKGKWYHAACTYDGETWKLYLNGELDGSVSVDIPKAQPGMRFMIGGTKGWPPSLVGAIDQVKVYDHALSQAQIKSIIKGQAPTNSVLEMPMDYEAGEATGVKYVEPGDNIRGTLSVEAEGFTVIPSVVSSPYYRVSLEQGSKETPNEWNFVIRPTERASGRKIDVRFNLYARSLWNVREIRPTVQKTLTIYVS